MLVDITSNTFYKLQRLTERTVYPGKVAAMSQKGDLHIRLDGSNAGVRHCCPYAISVCIEQKAHQLSCRTIKISQISTRDARKVQCHLFLVFSAHPCHTVER
jgi:hypothetical protein